MRIYRKVSCLTFSQVANKLFLSSVLTSGALVLARVHHLQLGWVTRVGSTEHPTSGLSLLQTTAPKREKATQHTAQRKPKIFKVHYED